eukprot:332784-Prymnesium_polylepis.2
MARGGRGNAVVLPRAAPRAALSRCECTARPRGVFRDASISFSSARPRPVHRGRCRQAARPRTPPLSPRSLPMLVGTKWSSPAAALPGSRTHRTCGAGDRTRDLCITTRSAEGARSNDSSYAALPERRVRHLNLFARELRAVCNRAK